MLPSRVNSREKEHDRIGGRGSASGVAQQPGAVRMKGKSIASCLVTVIRQSSPSDTERTVGNPQVGRKRASRRFTLHLPNPQTRTTSRLLDRLALRGST